jgi:protein tyrosine phosphatase (PTP) superfamily phosphohydrolase (DUF442 family)
MASTIEICNAIKVSDLITTGGQPTEDQLKAAATEGFQAVINLAPFDPSRSLRDEPGLVESLGMSYTYIPVAWDNPTSSDFAAFEQAMNEAGDNKTLIHCAANFRITAFYALYAQKHLGWSEAQADTFRAQVWQGSDYPIWEDFITRMKQEIAK